MGLPMSDKEITIKQGKTFSLPIRWEAPPIVYKPITAITKAAPCRITVPGHGVPNGWRVTIVSVNGMKEINAKSSPPADTDYVQATVIDADTIELNTINSSGFTAYTSGGYVQYNTPVDITGMKARMTIRDKLGGSSLFSLTSENGRILIDAVNHIVTPKIAATDTATFTWKKGWYDLEMVSADDIEVTEILRGPVRLELEATT